MFNKFMNFVLPTIIRWCEKRNRYKIILCPKEEGRPYLVRYFLLTSKYFCVYIHQFISSDLAEYHDHPFDFVSYIIRGHYSEKSLCPQKGSITIKQIKQGSWNFRSKNHAHIVSTPGPTLCLEDKNKATTTLVFRGPYRQNWGFWVQEYNTGPYKWVYFERYLQKDPDLKVPDAKDGDIEGF